MCGIVGILLAPHAVDPRRLAAVEAMAATLHHRGPDSSGAWVDHDAGIALGHRRLAIVDLSAAGHQPMLSHSARLVMTFNGEVYNFAELRPELEYLGHCFRGQSDSEVMLSAFESFGIEEALKRFAGMFAIGLWDRKHRILHLIRDRLGKKPLYVALLPGALLFASELKAILAYPGFLPRVDPKALAMVLRHGWVPDQCCIWDGVFKLPPGTMLSVRGDDLVAGGGAWLRQRARAWWSLAEIAEAGQHAPLDLKPPELEGELDRLLRTVVRQRLVADVPLGAFLSGGIDSTTVVALMQAQSARPVRTFTIGFGEAGYDEACHASQLARHLGTEHTEFRLTPAETLAVIPELPRIWDEPFADESQIPTLLLARLARQHVTVALSGDGGDECFGGYARHFMTARLAPILRLPSMLRRVAASGLLMLRPGVWDELLRGLPLPASMRPTLRGENLQKCARVLEITDERDLYELLTTLSPSPMTLDPGEVDATRVPPLSDAVSRLIYRDMADYLPGDILVKLDRATMAASLEGRSPFLDHRMVEFAWRLPTAVKVRGGQGKWLLRRVLRRYLPQALFERPKQGFNVPIGAWLIGPLREWAEELLDGSRIRRDGFLDDVRVQACWHEHLSGRSDRAGELWAILMVQAWLDAMRNPYAPLASTAVVKGVADCAIPVDPRTRDYQVLHEGSG
jgi:asparagine synthase (glutamine-hydrolysing)